jgi:hypothetical protein
VTDWYSLLRPPYIYLILGVVSFSWAMVSTYTGKTWARFGGWVYRAEDSTEFWWIVAIYYLSGVLFVGIFLLH